MHEKRRRKRSELRFHAISGSSEPIKKNGVKMMVTAPAPRYAIFYICFHYPKGAKRSKNAIFVLWKGLYSRNVV